MRRLTVGQGVLPWYIGTGGREACRGLVDGRRRDPGGSGSGRDWSTTLVSVLVTR